MGDDSRLRASPAEKIKAQAGSGQNEPSWFTGNLYTVSLVSLTHMNSSAVDVPVLIAKIVWCRCRIMMSPVVDSSCLWLDHLAGF